MINILDLRCYNLAIFIGDLRKYFPGVQRLAIFIKHGQVIPFISFTGFPTSSIHSIPVRLPIEHACSPAAGHIGQTFHHGSEAGSLPLYRTAESANLFLSRAIAILLLIEVFIGITESRFHDNNILLIAGADVIEIVLQLV